MTIASNLIDQVVSGVSVERALREFKLNPEAEARRKERYAAPHLPQHNLGETDIYRVLDTEDGNTTAVLKDKKMWKQFKKYFNKAQKEIGKIGDHFRTMGDAMREVAEILKKNKIPTTIFSNVMFSGREGRATLPVLIYDWDKNKGAYLVVTWYKMPSGRMEVIKYLTW